ncbi:MAG: UDP-N-acetylmuramoyl-L-alanine--D-glutamate ligase [Bifidobacteriaceae bacterium]|jgi:UDP-N-acetylmuramoylalanine--D-glutamate ligase|nr:UDP-N-acetylmuramoyl-L-alanine--D-glutamate ligase [Bifidobacteriaceae bacterium]
MRKNVLVIGLGVTGKKAQKVLQKFYNVLTFDEKVASDFTTVRELEDCVRNLTAENLLEFALISPGFPPNSLVANLLDELKVNVLSELDVLHILLKLVRTKKVLIGITGTNGKTTVTRLVTQILNESSILAKSVGNIGESMLEAALDPNIQALVIELSSFQLHWTKSVDLDIACILNIEQDHTDWHESHDNYERAKYRVFDGAVYKRITPNDILNSINGQDVMSVLSKSKLAWAARQDGVLWQHLRYDITAAILIALPLNDIMCAELVTNESIMSALSTFQLDPHRSEQLRELMHENGTATPVIDDSKATNTHASLAAIVANPLSSVILILGGLTKGVDFTDYIATAAPHIKAFILIGKDKENILNAIRADEYASRIQLFDIPDNDYVMETAVQRAFSVATGNDIILLSPATASFDQFESYSKRGEKFQEAVRAHFTRYLDDK